MKPAVVCAGVAIAVASIAYAQASLTPSGESAYYSEPVGSEFLSDCRFTGGLETSDWPDNQANGQSCGRAIIDWLADTGRYTQGEAQGATQAKVACGARLIVADGDPDKSARQVLDAEFDKSCGEAATM